VTAADIARCDGAQMEFVMSFEKLGFLLPLFVLAMPLAYAFDQGAQRANSASLASKTASLDAECEAAFANKDLVIEVHYSSATSPADATFAGNVSQKTAARAFCRT
jgi:hypothetical protein